MQYNSLNVKLPNSQLNKLKSAIKNQTKIVLRLPLNMVGDDETNFPQIFLINYYQLIDKLQIFIKPLQIIYELILSYQKLKYLR